MSLENNGKTGGCICGNVRYQVTSKPLIVHGCHCRGCQKNTGSAFAINALFETDQVTLLAGQVETISVPTPSGTGQDITRCVDCKVAVWSNYNMAGLRKYIRFVRVGTLDDPDQFPPDIHIFTASKQPWVILPDGAPRVDAFYDFKKTWSPENYERRKELLAMAGIDTA